ncbi:MAG: hypothetical protein WC460_03560 [Patescibacteria group bacterium]
MDNIFRIMEINVPGWDMIKTALELYNIYYLDEFLRDPGYLEICRDCGLQGNEKRAIALTISEIEAQKNGSSRPASRGEPKPDNEIFKISLLLPQWTLICNIIEDFYESVLANAESEAGKTITLDIKEEDWDAYLSNLETLLDALICLTEGTQNASNLN